MITELFAGIILWIVIFLFPIVIGNDLFAIMVDEQVHYLHLIVFYAPISATARMPYLPEPVAQYVSWALGEHRDPVGCVHIRHSGRIRYGTTGRWMKMNGEAFFSLAAPAFVWHTTITYIPGIWLKTFDYSVHRQAGMNLSLFSFIPLNKFLGEEIKTPSLFRYLASTPLFPIVFSFSRAVTWETIDDSAAKMIIRDKDLVVEAIGRFDGCGKMVSIMSSSRIHPVTGRLVPGHFNCRFSSYSDVQGYQIPQQISTDLLLPDGKYACAEFTISSIEFDATGKIHRGKA